MYEKEKNDKYNVQLYSLPRQIGVTISLIRNSTLFKEVTFLKRAPDSAPLLRNVTFLYLVNCSETIEKLLISQYFRIVRTEAEAEGC